MAKKATGKHYTSKGERKANQKISNAVRNDRSEAENMINKYKAYEAGKKVFLTVPNPNPNETNKKFIKIDARSVWGDPKKRNSYEPNRI
jgi:hypothetical protein